MLVGQHRRAELPHGLAEPSSLVQGLGLAVAWRRTADPSSRKSATPCTGYAPREQTPALWKTVNTLSQADFERLLRDTRLIVATALGGVCG